MEYKFLMLCSVCLMIMGACEVASLRQMESLSTSSKTEQLPNTSRKYFRRIHYQNNGYGYNGLLDKIRKEDCTRFTDSAYMDYTGAGQYRDSQLAKTFEKIKSTPFGNTHSNSPASKNSEVEVENARNVILDWFHTSSRDYDVVFTSGATAGLHLVGETFSWTPQSHFYYLRENHNSVLGIREIALHSGASFHVVSSSDVEEECNMPSSDKPSGKANNLFAFPLEENFSGKIFPKNWITQIQGKNHFDCSGNWYVLLDLAAYAPTHDFNLTEYPADFVVLSFYKIFGFPTGIGALLIRKSSAHVLNKVYYGGGSVLQTVTKSGEHRVPSSISRRFEDGTPNFLGILSIPYGFDAIREVGGIEAVNKHTTIVTQYLVAKLKQLVHSTGVPLLRIYGNHDTESELQGPIVTVNVQTPDKTLVSFVEVEKAAARHKIHLRAGWHCNPGAAYASLGLSEETVIQQIREHQCFSGECSHQSALTVVNGVMAGGVRISLGYMTTFEDCDRVVEFFRSEYLHWIFCLTS